ncbi:hypothetical protein BGZ46_003505, partial [Entomortierella lignicola]
MASISSSLPKTFKSVYYTSFGSPSKVLTFNKSTPLPAITGSNVLIKVHASSINPIDWKLMKGGVPRIVMPKIKVPCLDISGTVVALGPKAGKKFSIGDEILAMLQLTQTGGLS